MVATGHRVVLAGRQPASVSQSTEKPPTSPDTTGIHAIDLPVLDKGNFRELCRSQHVRGAILLGYPDQFPFLAEGTPPVPVFFWAQFSKSIFHPELENTVIVPLTEMTRDYLVQAGYRRVEEALPHGVDTNCIAPDRNREKRAGNESPVLLTIGANSYRKRFDDLLRAFAIILRKRPDIRLIIKTDAKSKPGGFDLQKLSRSTETEANLSIIDRSIPEKELARLYTSADLYLHTAEWEGFGIPVIEAMAAGLPVLTHRGQGPGEILPNTNPLVRKAGNVDEEGSQLSKIDPENLAENTLALLNDPEKMSRIGTANRKRAESQFDIRLIRDRWVDLISQAGAPLQISRLQS